MLGVSLAIQTQHSPRTEVSFPSGFAWDRARFGFDASQIGNQFHADLDPRALVDPRIWTGPAFHVDQNGNDANAGLGAFDGDFSNAKRTIHAAFTEGNATGAPYRVIVNSGQYEGSAFTRNGNVEPNQPVALVSHSGRVSYRTGPFSVSWQEAGGTYATSIQSVRRAFRTDILTDEGLYTELDFVADLATCVGTENSWTVDGTQTHVNIGRAPNAIDIALMRSFHGARFLQNEHDFYIEGFDIEGGITGALHFDQQSTRNIVCVKSSFRYSAPSNPSSPQDAVRIRRNNGLVAFFNCDASCGAKDGFSFHDDGVDGMHVLLQDCTSWRNGSPAATSVNGFTLHDRVRAISFNGEYGLSAIGSEVHIIQEAQAWIAGGRAVARDPDGTSTAFKCSNASKMWLQNVVADAQGPGQNYALEVNGGTAFTRGFTVVSGGVDVMSGGSVSPF